MISTKSFFVAEIRQVIAPWKTLMTTDFHKLIILIILVNQGSLLSCNTRLRRRPSSSENDADENLWKTDLLKS